MPQKHTIAVPAAIPLVEGVFDEGETVQRVTVHHAASPAALRLLQHLLAHAEADPAPQRRNAVDWPPAWARGDADLETLPFPALREVADELLSITVTCHLGPSAAGGFPCMGDVAVMLREEGDRETLMQLQWAFAKPLEGRLPAWRRVLADAGLLPGGARKG